MLLIIGLGNPGNRYTNTRHNVGFMALDALALTYGVRYSKQYGGNYASVKIKFAKQDIILIKPLTYMNRSGIIVPAVQKKYGRFVADTETVQLLVLCDNLDLPSAHVKVKWGRGSAGQNGLKSIMQHWSGEFWRCFIGIGRPDHGDIAQYVLESIAAHEKQKFENCINRLQQGISVYAEDSNAQAFMNYCNNNVS